jgi:AraC-like DNA-binding protein
MAKTMCRPQDEVALQALRRARDQIDRDYGSDITVSTIARLAGYSTSRFIRAFRNSYGETPGQYRSRRRIERARELLRASDLTVTEICLQVGFSSLRSFSSSLHPQRRSFSHPLPPGGGSAGRRRVDPGLLCSDVAERIARRHLGCADQCDQLTRAIWEKLRDLGSA